MNTCKDFKKIEKLLLVKKLFVNNRWTPWPVKCGRGFCLQTVVQLILKTSLQILFFITFDIAYDFDGCSVNKWFSALEIDWNAAGKEGENQYRRNEYRSDQ